MKPLPFLAFFFMLLTTADAQDLTIYGNKQANQLVTLTAQQRDSTGQALQNTVYELIALRHALQQAHWNVVGPLFYSLHDLLGHFYKDINGTIDRVAERRRALLLPVDGRPEAVAKNAQMNSVPLGLLKDYDVPKLLGQLYLTVAQRLRDRIKMTEKSDLVTQDLLIAVADTVESHLWKLRAFQRQEEGVQLKIFKSPNPSIPTILHKVLKPVWNKKALAFFSGIQRADRDR
jgi:starvation-inducible DNA-binding protein